MRFVRMENLLPAEHVAGRNRTAWRCNIDHTISKRNRAGR
jgi:hypothetical protein